MLRMNRVSVSESREFTRFGGHYEKDRIQFGWINNHCVCIGALRNYVGPNNKEARIKKGHNGQKDSNYPNPFSR